MERFIRENNLEFFSDKNPTSPDTIDEFEAVNDAKLPVNDIFPSSHAISSNVGESPKLSSAKMSQDENNEGVAKIGIKDEGSRKSRRKRKNGDQQKCTLL